MVKRSTSRVSTPTTSPPKRSRTSTAKAAAALADSVGYAGLTPDYKGTHVEEQQIGKRSSGRTKSSVSSTYYTGASKPGSRQGVSEDGKASKGLRHFSMKVCKKVESKGQTTYNEVADELVREFIMGREDTGEVITAGKKAKGVYDEKNIRRRVYDALNVLMAMDIISKEKKEIRWKGLPSNAQHDMDMLKKERDGKVEDVRRKREQLRELLKQGRGYRMLREHNQNNSKSPINPSLSLDSPSPTTSSNNDDDKIPLPFIVVSTDEGTQVQCEMGSDRTDVFFNFSKPFEINDDNEILKRMGFGLSDDDDSLSGEGANGKGIESEGGEEIEKYFKDVEKRSQKEKVVG